MNRKKAFAFIELLVNLALVALLIGCLIPYYKHASKRINLRIARREIFILKTAVNSYYENRTPNTYPSSTDNLCADFLLTTKPPVVKSVFYDLLSKKKREYHYAVSSNRQHYCIWTVGLNGASEIYSIDNRGNVIKGKKCDDLYATATADPPPVK